jgi:hypothetical protein
METHVTDITHAIQLAVAPVFLMTAIAALITALSNRLGRIVDRRRVILGRVADASGVDIADANIELGMLSQRIRLVYLAIFSAVVADLMICLVVVSAFLGALLATDLARVVAILFILAMLALIVCLGFFLREIFIAVSGGTHYSR